MVKKETCACCGGNKIVTVKTPEGTVSKRPCPECNGQGYKVRVVHYV